MSFFENIRDKAVSTFNQVLDRKSESGLTKDEQFCIENNLPDNELIRAESAAEIRVKSDHYKDIYKGIPLPQGKIYVTDHFLIFRDAYDKKNCSFTFNLSTIKKVERLQSVNYGCALAVSTHSKMTIILYLVGLRSECDHFANSLKVVLRSNLPNVPKLQSFIQTCYSEYLLSKNKISNEKVEHVPSGGLGLLFKFPGDARESRDKAKMKLWFDLFRVDGRNISIVKTPMFYRLVRVGLPNRLRGEIWELCCGSMYLRLDNQEKYSEILKENEGKKSVAIEEIEKDLNRSLPEYAAYQDKEGINRLRRVLTAYSWENPEVGYCQAMNIVVAALLIYMSEEQAFWTLNVLVGRIVPGYYSKTMYGTLLDQKVFESLVQETMPLLWEHLNKYDIQLSVVSLPWFLSLYLNSMPLVFAARIIDVFFLQGPKTLFQVALAILKLCGDSLLKAEDDGSFISIIKDYFQTLDLSAHPASPNAKYRQVTKFQELLVTSFKEFSNVDEELINKHRNKHRDTIFQNISTFVKRTELRNLPKVSNLDQTTLSIIYDRFYSIVQAQNITGGGSSMMDFQAFNKFMSEVCDWVSVSGNDVELENGRPFLQRLYKNWVSNPKDGLTLYDLVLGLNKLIDPDLMTALNNFFKLYDTELKDRIDREGILQLSEDLLFITMPWRDCYLLDLITENAIENAIADKIIEMKKEEGIDPLDSNIKLPTEIDINKQKLENQQVERYLSAASTFIQRAFEYAQPEKEETLIKDLAIDSKISHNAALDPNSPVYVNLPTFRMVILADETYELLFTRTLRCSFHLAKPIDPKLSGIRNLRSMFDGLLADGREVANKVRRRMDSAASNALHNHVNPSDQSSDHSSKSKGDDEEERDDDFGVISINEHDKDLLLGSEAQAFMDSSVPVTGTDIKQSHFHEKSRPKEEHDEKTKASDNLIEFET
ncbi:uncharacterized protein PRCAT00000282001 [Priceomyces carsonii]|uniref:uncharacterized protein n=1 Tax=Priceomyces carsonii TaxID=28549 RepID=UPI002ED89666|nr:unnamed protein product [Priceomyces carsonii]